MVIETNFFRDDQPSRAWCVWTCTAPSRRWGVKLKGTAARNAAVSASGGCVRLQGPRVGEGAARTGAHLEPAVADQLRRAAPTGSAHGLVPSSPRKSPASAEPSSAPARNRTLNRI